MPQLYIKDENGNFIEASETDYRPQHVVFPPLDANLATDADSYKYSHPFIWPEGVTNLYAYFASRGGRFHKIQAAGLQGIVKHNFLNPVLKRHIDEAEELATNHGEPFYREGWDAIVNDYKGFLPLTIRALPEGVIVPSNNVAMFDVQLTEPDKRLFWLPSHVETKLCRDWFPSIVGTQSLFCKKIILEALIKSSDAPEAELPFKLHDFGSRGVSSEESARIGGAAHLANFLGTDTVEAIRYIRHYYGGETAATGKIPAGTVKMMPGLSIPAAEHSNRCAWGKVREFEGYRQLIKAFLYDRQLPPGVPKLAACVCDTYNVYEAVDFFSDHSTSDYVKASGGTLVVRPDSGDPIEVLLKILGIFDRKLGMRKNNKGYKVLPDHYRLIQGDGINYESLQEILDALLAKGYSASNLAFGMGGGLLQMVNRDTGKFAYKAAAALIEGDWADLYKDPITDPGKKSLRGHLATVQEGFGGPIVTVRGPRKDDMLRPIFRNGKLLIDQTWDEVRANSAKALIELMQ